jgi:hypothetical protein
MLATKFVQCQLHDMSRLGDADVRILWDGDDIAPICTAAWSISEPHELPCSMSAVGDTSKEFKTG